MVVVMVIKQSLVVILIAICLARSHSAYMMDSSWHQSDEQNPLANSYEILGVDLFASQEEIDKTYKRLARKHHPDKNHGKEKPAEEQFKKVQAAAEMLRNAEQRKKYDLYLRQTDITIGCRALCKDAADLVGFLHSLLCCTSSDDHE